MFDVKVEEPFGGLRKYAPPPQKKKNKEKDPKIVGFHYHQDPNKVPQLRKSPIQRSMRVRQNADEKKRVSSMVDEPSMRF